MELRRSTLKNPIAPPKPEIKEMQIVEEAEDDTEEEDTHPPIEKEPIILKLISQVCTEEIIPEAKVIIEEPKVEVAEM